MNLLPSSLSGSGGGGGHHYTRSRTTTTTATTTKSPAYEYHRLDSCSPPSSPIPNEAAIATAAPKLARTTATATTTPPPAQSPIKTATPSTSTSTSTSLGLLLLMQSNGYRVVACLIALFVGMQFILNFTSYHTHYLQLQAPGGPLSGLSSDGIGAPPFPDHRRLEANAFLLEDMEMSAAAAAAGRTGQRGYLSRSDYVYQATPPSFDGTDSTAAMNNTANISSSSSLLTAANSSQVTAVSLKPCPAVPPALGQLLRSYACACASCACVCV